MDEEREDTVSSGAAVDFRKRREGRREKGEGRRERERECVCLCSIVEKTF